ncbi:MAG: glucose-6-phosphate dehydrogenase assembly protein OpcA [bacterium]
MTISVNRKAFPSSDLVLLDHGEAVDISQVESCLTGLWRAASEHSQEEREEGLALARLWNLVSYRAGAQASPSASGEEPGEEAETPGALLERVTMSMPARVIHLKDLRHVPPPAPGKDVEARVESHCLISHSGSKMVCCEAIHLTGYGEVGHSHFPAVLRALLVAHLPVALLWLDEVPRKGRLLGELLAMSDRLLVDTQRTSDTSSLLAVNDLMRNAGEQMVDLGWLRLRPMRYLVADFFDPPGRAEQLQRMEGITIETSPKGFNSGLMMAGWILSRLGLGESQGLTPVQGEGNLRWNMAHGAGVFPLDFSIREGYGGLDEIFRFEIRAGGDVFEIRDVDPEHVSISGPDRQLPSIALRESDGAELVVAALGGAPADVVFAQALGVAAHLVETLQWNQ